DFAVTNTAPDQTVAIADGGNGNVTVGGTYPNFTIDVPSNTDAQDISTDNNPGNITIDNGSTLNLNVDDADSDPNNEIELPSGGNNGQVLSTNGAGFYTWVDSNTGPQGPTGNDGATGPAGPQGIPGNDGATGPSGADGVDGAQGIQGETGPAGPAGADGVDGAQGIQGETGPAGPQGPAGADGVTSPSVNAIIRITDDITLTEEHQTIILLPSCSGRNCDGPTITLPSASSCIGRIYYIKNYSGGDSDISEYIDDEGDSDDKLDDGRGYMLQSDGVEWQLIIRG
ncbi:MAG: hypothetical protein V7692_15245, partial [Maribacter arcticus]